MYLVSLLLSLLLVLIVLATPRFMRNLSLPAHMVALFIAVYGLIPGSLAGHGVALDMTTFFMASGLSAAYLVRRERARIRQLRTPARAVSGQGGDPEMERYLYGSFLLVIVVLAFLCLHFHLMGVETLAHGIDGLLWPLTLIACHLVLVVISLSALHRYFWPIFR